MVTFLKQWRVIKAVLVILWVLSDLWILWILYDKFFSSLYLFEVHVSRRVYETNFKPKMFMPVKKIHATQQLIRLSQPGEK
jgi:hypothetical protein